MQHSQCAAPRRLVHDCGSSQLGDIMRFGQLGLLDWRTSKSTEAQQQQQSGSSSSSISTS